VKYLVETQLRGIEDKNLELSKKVNTFKSDTLRELEKREVT
jgi:hypothetical protein